MVRLIDDRRWVGSSDISEGAGYSIDLSPQLDRPLRPVEILNLITANLTGAASIKSLINAQATAWKAAIVDGRFEDVVLQDQPGVIYHVARIRDDVLSGDINVMSCICEGAGRIGVATYERLGAFDSDGSRKWASILSELSNECRWWSPEDVRAFGTRGEGPLYPALISHLEHSQHPQKSEIIEIARSARMLSGGGSQLSDLLAPLQIIADHSRLARGCSSEALDELVSGGEFLALFGLRNGVDQVFGVAAGSLARVLVVCSDRSDARIERSLKLSRWMCDRGPEFVFEQAALTHIVGVCKRSALHGRNDAIEAAGWLIDVLQRRPAEAARIIFRLVSETVPLYEAGDGGSLEDLNRLDLATFLLDTMLPLEVDTSDLIRSEPLRESDCPLEIDFQKARGRTFFPGNAAPLRAIMALIIDRSHKAQTNLLGFDVPNVPYPDTKLTRVRGLYLRSFRQTRRLPIPNHFLPNDWNITADDIEPSTFSLEAAIHRSVVQILHVIPLAGPTDVLGMGRVYSTPVGTRSQLDAWKKRVVNMLSILHLVVYVPDDTESMHWEAKQIADAHMLSHTIFVMLPSEIDDRSADRWAKFRALDLPYAPQLPAFNPAGSFVWFDQRGEPMLEPFDAIYDHRLCQLALAIAKGPERIELASSSV